MSIAQDIRRAAMECRDDEPWLDIIDDVCVSFVDDSDEKETDSLHWPTHRLFVAEALDGGNGGTA